MKDRLQTILNLEKLSAAQMASLLMIQRSTLSNLLSGRNNPSFDFILAIMTKLPNLNIEWLLRGEGIPYKNPEKNFRGESLFDANNVRQYDAIKEAGEPHPILSQSDTAEEPQYSNDNLFGFSDLPDGDLPEEEAYHPYPALEAGELERRVNSMQQTEKEDIKPKITVSEPSENPVNEEILAPTPIKVILLYSDGTFESFEK